MYDDSFHQKLMDEAYDMWHENEDWSYETFINALDEKHKAAVLVGNLNYQVENGGFEQWDANGYSSKVDDLLEVLIKFVEDTGSEVGKRVLSLIEIYMEEVQPLGEDDSEYSFYENRLNKEYYEINKYFLEEFNEWLIKKYGTTEEKQKVVE